MIQLKPLPFPKNALEPYMDEKTVEIHHKKHHQTYVNNANKVLETIPELQGKTTNEILININTAPEEKRQALINQVGGVSNHDFFWSILSEEKNTQPIGTLNEKIIQTFGSFEKFKEKFTQSALSLFGSGWTWLGEKDDKLEIINTFNQESILSKNYKRIITIDVWEHAYYLKYQNKRAEFLENFWNILDWKKINEMYHE